MRKFMIAGGLVLASVVGAQAADLMIDEAPAPMDTSLVNSSIYVQLLGGVALPGDIDFYDDYGDFDGIETYDAGVAVAGTIGVVVMDGLSVEADTMYTKRVNAEDSEYTVASTSLMGNVKYTVPLNDMFSIYGAAGVGLISYDFETGKDPFSYGGVGYQLIAGVGAKLTDNITAIAEYRYQNTFDVARETENDLYAIQAPISTVLAGVKLAF